MSARPLPAAAGALAIAGAGATTVAITETSGEAYARLGLTGPIQDPAPDCLMEAGS